MAGRKIAGRTKGTPNKAKQAFRDRLAAYCARHKVDPHYAMVKWLADTSETAHLTADGETVLQPSVPLAVKFDCAKELASYLQPKLRSVVVSGDPDNPLSVLQALPDAQLDALIHRKMREAGYEAAAHLLTADSVDPGLTSPAGYDGGHQALPEGTA